MEKKHVFIIGAAVVVVGVAAYMLVTRSNTLGYTGPSYVPPAPTPADPSNPSANKSLYSKMGLILRSTPTVDSGFLGSGIGGNVYESISAAGTYVGTVAMVVPDKDGIVNPATNFPYNWYKLNLSPLLFMGDGDVYAREDYVTVS